MMTPHLHIRKLASVGFLSYEVLQEFRKGGGKFFQVKQHTNQFWEVNEHFALKSEYDSCLFIVDIIL